MILSGSDFCLFLSIRFLENNNRQIQIMSKNTANSAFRKIDVDQYNEDNYREDDAGEPQSPPIGPDENEITNLINQYPFLTT